MNHKEGSLARAGNQGREAEAYDRKNTMEAASQRGGWGNPGATAALGPCDEQHAKPAVLADWNLREISHSRKPARRGIERNT